MIELSLEKNHSSLPAKRESFLLSTESLRSSISEWHLLKLCSFSIGQHLSKAGEVFSTNIASSTIETVVCVVEAHSSEVWSQVQKSWVLSLGCRIHGALVFIPEPGTDTQVISKGAPTLHRALNDSSLPPIYLLLNSSTLLLTDESPPS